MGVVADVPAYLQGFETQLLHEQIVRYEGFQHTYKGSKLGMVLPPAVGIPMFQHTYKGSKPDNFGNSYAPGSSSSIPTRVRNKLGEDADLDEVLSSSIPTRVRNRLYTQAKWVSRYGFQHTYKGSKHLNTQQSADYCEGSSIPTRVRNPRWAVKVCNADQTFQHTYKGSKRAFMGIKGWAELRSSIPTRVRNFSLTSISMCFSFCSSIPTRVRNHSNSYSE